MVQYVSKGVDGMANSFDPEQSDLGLHSLSRPVCTNTCDHYSIFQMLLNEIHKNNNFFLDHSLKCYKSQ